jgi:hypothetical protein
MICLVAFVKHVLWREAGNCEGERNSFQHVLLLVTAFVFVIRVRILQSLAVAFFAD